MVYILAANKYLPYENGRSKILYQGTTKKGAGRPAVNKASDVYYKLHGGKTIDVQIATCAKRNKVQTWKELESALLGVFRKRYFELPHYN